MTRYYGGEEVRSGFYWNPGRWEIVPVGKKGAVLPGTKEIRYLKIPTLLLMVMGPVLGGLYMIFLPLIGFAMLFSVAAMKVVALCREAMASLLAEERK